MAVDVKREGVGELRVVVTGEYEISGHSKAVTCIAYEGDVFVTGSCDGNLIVWSTKPPHKILRKLVGHTASVECVGIADLKIISGSRCGEIHIWSLLNGNCLNVIKLDKVTISCIAVKNEHEFFCGIFPLVKADPNSKKKANLHKILEYNVDTGKVLRRMAETMGGVQCIAINSDIIVGAFGSILNIFSMKTGRLLKSLGEIRREFISSVILKDDLIVCGSFKGTIKVWSIKSARCLSTLIHSQPSSPVIDEEHEVYLGWYGNDTVVSCSPDSSLMKVWNVKDGTMLKQMRGHEDGIAVFSWANDYVLGCDPEIFLKGWPVSASGTVLKKSLKDKREPIGMDWQITPDGYIVGTISFQRLYCKFDPDSEMTLEMGLWEAKTGEFLGKFTNDLKRIHPEVPMTITCLGIDGDVIVTGSEFNSVIVWSLKERKALFCLHDGTSYETYKNPEDNGAEYDCLYGSYYPTLFRVDDISVANDIVAFSSGEETDDGRPFVQVWSLRSRQLLRKLSEPRPDLKILSISRKSSEQIVAMMDNRQLEIWDRVDSEEEFQVTNVIKMSDDVGEAAVSDFYIEDDLLFTLDLTIETQAINVWSMKTLKCVNTFDISHLTDNADLGFGSGFIAVAYDADGKIEIRNNQTFEVLCSSFVHFDQYKKISCTEEFEDERFSMQGITVTENLIAMQVSGRSFALVEYHAQTQETK